MTGSAADSQRLCSKILTLAAIGMKILRVKTLHNNLVVLVLIGVGELLPPHLEFWVIALSGQSWRVTGWSVLGATLAKGWICFTARWNPAEGKFCPPTVTNSARVLLKVISHQTPLPQSIYFYL